MSFLLPTLFMSFRGPSTWCGAESKWSAQDSHLRPAGSSWESSELRRGINAQLVFTSSLDVYHSVLCEIHSAKVLSQGTWDSHTKREMPGDQHMAALGFQEGIIWELCAHFPRDSKHPGIIQRVVCNSDTRLWQITWAGMWLRTQTCQLSWFKKKKNTMMKFKKFFHIFVFSHYYFIVLKMVISLSQWWTI